MDVGQLLQAAAQKIAITSAVSQIADGTLGCAGLPAASSGFPVAHLPAIGGTDPVLTAALSSLAAQVAPAPQPLVSPPLVPLATQLASLNCVGLGIGAVDPTVALLLARAQQNIAGQQFALDGLQRLQNLQNLPTAPALHPLLAEQQKQQHMQQLPQGSCPLALAEAAISGTGSLDLLSTASSAISGNVAAPSLGPDPSGAVSAAAALELLNRLRQGQEAAAVAAAAAAHRPPPPPPSVPPHPAVVQAPVVVQPTMPAAQPPIVVQPTVAVPQAPVVVQPTVAVTPPPLVAPPAGGATANASVSEATGAQRVVNSEDSPAAKAKAAAKARVDAEVQRKKEEDAMKCHLHKKPKDNCKFCKRFQEFVSSQALRAAEFEGSRQRRGGSAQSKDDDKRKPIEIANPKTFGFSPLVLTHIVESTYYQSTLSLQSVDAIVEEAKEYAKSVDPYMQDSTTMPSPFFCLVHRLFTLGVDGNQMFQLMDSMESPYVRCLGFVYLRFGLHTDRLWGWLGEYVLDDEEFQPAFGSGKWTTIGEFVEELLYEDKYYGAVLPRVTGTIRRQLEEKLAPVAQCRKRTFANREVLELYRQKGTRVEACVDGIWIDATVVELVEDFPSRLKVRVRVSGQENVEESIHLGKVIVRDPLPAGFVPDRRERSRSRDRYDWSRHKGKSDQELVEDLRRGARERAVCTSGKEYSKRPTTFDKGLAKPREGQGVAARRLLEEETVVKVSSSKRRRSPSPSEMQPKQKEESAEHKERMKKLFEKYGNVKSTETKSQDLNAIETTDVLRLG